MYCQGTNIDPAPPPFPVLFLLFARAAASQGNAPTHVGDELAAKPTAAATATAAALADTIAAASAAEPEEDTDVESDEENAKVR